MIKHLIIPILAGALLAGCGGGSGSASTDTSPTMAATTVQGKIVDDQDQPINGATITADGQTTQSNGDGDYEISVNAALESVVLIIKKDGYGTNAKIAPIQANLASPLDIKLFAHDIQTTFSSAAGATVVASNNASVKIEPNSVQTSNGMPYAGTVTISVSYHGPDTVAGVEAFPQPYSGTDNGQLALLRSVGFMEVILSDSQGNALQLDSTAPATLTFPTSSVAEGAASIPLWYYDEALKIWVREGTATLQSDGTYQGQVQHFTLWNVDIPYMRAEGTRIIGCVNNSNGQPIAGLAVTVRGRGWNLRGTTGPDGTFETYVASGTEIYVGYYVNRQLAVPEVELSPLQAGEVRQLDCQIITQAVDPATSWTAPPITPLPTQTTPLPAPVQNYAGVYAGTFSGADSGTFTVTLGVNGLVTGSGYSNVYMVNFSVSGSIAAGGEISLNTSGTAGNAVFTGNVNPVTGIVSGNWNVFGEPGTGGTFTGQKQ